MAFSAHQRQLAVRERPGAELCVHGGNLASAVRRLAADRPAGRSLSIGDHGVVDED